MSRTTPPRPVDVAAAFPALASLVRTATRLHPRAGSPSPHDSSVGGPPLWPAAEPWPYCDGPHEPDGTPPTRAADVHLLRRIRAAAAGRPGRGLGRFTPEELADLRRIEEDAPPWPKEPIAMLPVAQLHTRDVPRLLPFAPEGADLLQVLWCPFDHGLAPYPATSLHWRTAADVAEVLAPPEPAAVQRRGYVPEPCATDPEEANEYPALLELDADLQERIAEWSERHAAAGIEPEEYYPLELSVAPGWKAGGWTHWGLTDPRPLTCSACGSAMAPLLTIASSEWDDDASSWIPVEDRAHAVRRGADPDPDPSDPPAIEVGGGYSLQLYACPEQPGHPHAALIQ